MKPTDSEINAAITILRRRGFAVTSPQADAWQSVAALRRRIGWSGSVNGFTKRLHHPRCPHIQRRVGPSGRLLELRPTPELLAWLRAAKQPGRAL